MEKSYTSTTSEFVLLAITVLPLLYLLLIWPELPATVPIHFGPDGQPDGFGSKQGFATGLLLISATMYVLLRLLPAIDPKKKLMSASYGRVRFTLTLFMAGLACVILYIIQSGRTGDVVSDLILSAVFLLLAAMGNVMLTVPQNYFVGIKTPWALASETNWRKTHRLAGKLWVAGGLGALIISLFLPPAAKTVLTITLVTVLAVVPYVYSYRLFKQGLALLIVWLLGTSVQAQTEETLRYVITQPAGASLTLEGTLTLPAAQLKPLPVVVLVAGSGPTDRNGNSSMPGLQQMNVFRQLADSLVKRGVAVLRYDKRGSGTNLMLYAVRLNKSAPDFNYLVGDAAGFIRQLQADKRFASVTVAGHSEGALVGLLAAMQTKASRYVSLAGAGQPIGEIMKQQNRESGAPPAMIETAIKSLDSLQAGQLVHHPMVLGSLLLSQQPYLISWMKHDPAQALEQFSGPVLIVQGKRDMQVATSEAERLKAARPAARLVYFDTMSHLLKEAPAERMANFATYKDPNLSIIPAVADTIAAFVKEK